MAFRGLSFGGKMVALGLGAATVAGFLNFYHIPYYTDMYKVMWKVNEIPRFKREMIVEEWKKLQANGSSEENSSLLKKHLTKKLMESLKNYKTQRHGNLFLVMQEGIYHPQSPIGANAPDMDCYELFRPLFDPIINELHPDFQVKQQQHPKQSYWGDEKSLNYFGDTLKNLGDDEKRFVKNIRLECFRSLKYFTFQPLMTESDYFQYEYWINRFFNETPGYGPASSNNGANSNLAGKLYTFRKMSDSDNKQLELAAPQFYFKNNDKRLEAAGVYQNWPIARALYVNDSKNFAVQLNNEEHLKFISLTGPSCDLKSALKRLADGVKIIENVAPFSKTDRLGYVNSSPRYLGTGLNVYFDLNLPNLSKKQDFQEICKNLHLCVDDKKGQHNNSTITVTNSSQLGSNEFDTVKFVFDGVKKLIEMEKSA